MFSHITIGTNDLDKSRKFYDAILGAIGLPPANVDVKRGSIAYATQTGVLAILTPINGKAATAANGGTIGFACASPAQADAWHAAGVANGGTSIEDPPGVRENPMGNLYLAYLRDPDGNKLCAAHRMS